MGKVEVTERRGSGEPRAYTGARARRETIEVGPEDADEGPSARFRKSLAVVIGIDTYGEGIPPLRSAVADAEAIACVLERDHGFQVWRHFDDSARLPRLLTLLREELPAALGPDDRLLFYFAGHGIARDGEAGPAGYLVPAYATRSDERGFLSMHVLHESLARLPVRHALIVLDCCFAGTFRWSSLRDVEPMSPRIYRERYDLFLESPAWQVLTSTAADQLALDVLAGDRREGEGSHSPFALALLDGLAGGADYTQDHVITADELAIFVRQRVAPAAEGVEHRQVPQLFPLEKHRGGQFLFQVPNRPLALEPAPPLDEHRDPYRGLQGFREEDRAEFHGRDAVARRLADAVAERRLTVVVGSGTGKSTLVQAGVAPLLSGRGWTVLATQRPGRTPLAALGALARELGADPAAAAADPVAAWRDVVTRHASDVPCLAVIDQLEELVTHRADPRGGEAFLEALASAIRTAPWLHLVVIVRCDAELQLRAGALRPWWSTGRFVVPLMTRDELRKIIEEPTTRAVLRFDPPELVERLIDDVALVPAPLPLLSFALGELYRRCWARWQRGERDRALREADYDAFGGVAGALTRRATALHDELVAEDPAYEVTMRNVFLRMIGLSGGELVRRRAHDHELDYDDPAENRRVAQVLERFDRARLISRGTELRADGRASRYAEPAHDVLVRGWARMRDWLDEVDASACARALRGALVAAVSLWQTHEEHDAYLWSNLHVGLIEPLGRDRVLNKHEARFVRRSARVWHGESANSRPPR